MSVQLNHTIVRVRDKRESAEFLAELLGVGPPTAFGPFLVVQVDNDVSLDFADDHGPVHPQHYAFLVGEDEFDQIFGRIRDRGLTWWADPGRRRPGQINTNDGGRGVYWEDPSGHFLEIITRPYGSGPRRAGCRGGSGQAASAAAGVAVLGRWRTVPASSRRVPRTWAWSRRRQRPSSQRARPSRSRRRAARAACLHGTGRAVRYSPDRQVQPKRRTPWSMPRMATR
jgi:catechol 2,3-dioxygenase-like lactoylglutathione lyase family enzyme